LWRTMHQAARMRRRHFAKLDKANWFISEFLAVCISNAGFRITTESLERLVFKYQTHGARGFFSMAFSHAQRASSHIPCFVGIEYMLAAISSASRW
ncbi:MAG: hypothetical protein PHQ39_14240, partial [Methanothrix soehngenii]|nr:hypothetical protein [Methanothrix soehngenii]